MAGAALNGAGEMNSFETFLEKLGAVVQATNDIRMHVDEPLNPQGRWTVAIAANDGYLIEVEWSRHLGFGIAAGKDLDFGAGIDEIFGSSDAALARVCKLLEARLPTDKETIGLAELRKIQGVLQKDVAERLGITKSGVAQMEGSTSLDVMQIATLRKLIGSLGGELILMARFPEGREREIAID